MVGLKHIIRKITAFHWQISVLIPLGGIPQITSPSYSIHLCHPFITQPITKATGCTTDCRLVWARVVAFWPPPHSSSPALLPSE